MHRTNPVSAVLKPSCKSGTWFRKPWRLRRSRCYPSCGKAAVTKVPVCTCAVCVSSLLTITACRGKNGRADKARVVQVSSPPAETAMSSWAEVSGNGFFLSVVVTASDETDCYRQGEQLAKLKIHCFHLNRGEWFSIKSELEHHILVFLATGHSYFWENKNWGLPLLLSSLLCMFSDNFA